MTESSHTGKPTVVVVGGGYGGVAVAKALDNTSDVVLVEPKDAFMHNIAALRALVDPSWLPRIFLPYAGLLTNGRVLRDRAVVVDPHRVVTASGEEIFATSELNESEAMIELSRRLNLEIMRAARGVRSCPAFAGCYNEELGTVCYVNAGHTPGLLRDDASVVELPATGLPLGLFSLAPTDARIVGLGPKGSLAVVSRGVVEAESKKVEFGLDGVKSILQAGPASAKDLSRRILRGVQDFMHMAPKHNDVTALTLTRGN